MNQIRNAFKTIIGTTFSLMAFGASSTMLKCESLKNEIIPDIFFELTETHLNKMADSDLLMVLDKYEISDKETYYFGLKLGEHGISSIKINKYDLKMEIVARTEIGTAYFDYQCQIIEKLI